VAVGAMITRLLYLPSKIEWEELDKAVGGEKTAGGKLKTKSGWNENGSGNGAYSRFMFYDGKLATWGNFIKYGLLSVRCVKDL